MHSPRGPLPRPEEGGAHDGAGAVPDDVIISILGVADDRSAGAGFMLFPRSIRSEAVWRTIDEARAGNRRSAEVRWSIDGLARGASQARPCGGIAGAGRAAAADSDPTPCARRPQDGSGSPSMRSPHRSMRSARAPTGIGGHCLAKDTRCVLFERFETAREEMANGTAPGSASEQSRRLAP